MKFKNIIHDGLVAYVVFGGFLTVLLSTNRFALSFLERAVEIGFNPLCINEWLWVLMEI